MPNTRLPPRISRLTNLSKNLRWSWYPPARELFGFLDRELWNSTHHNPMQILREINPIRLDKASTDLQFLDLYDRVAEEMDYYKSTNADWFTSWMKSPFRDPVAFFLFEFGIHGIGDNFIC
ncbi:MAG: DUF3417 domain-containing protein [Candidatus Heimdallarchaeota archaeon]|nr:DUF3417 domain-containing protein [Candidatus Heimdallarchaeota archaeon]